VALVDAESPAGQLFLTYTPPPVADSDKDTEEEPTSDEESATEKPTLASLYDAHVHKVVATGIRMRTSAEALASGRRGENCRTKAGKKREPFPGVSIYSKMFPGTIIQ
jgi:hypothetical protein